MAHDRRSFLRNAGLGGGVLALGPLATALSSGAAAAADESAGGKYDFDNIANRVGHDSVKWDGGLRTEKVDHLVAGMGIADMDFKCAPAISAALRKATQYDNWGYVDMAQPGRKAWIKSIVDWNQKRYGITAMNEGNMGILTGVHAGILATMRAYTKPGDKVLMATPIYNGFYGDIKATKTVANESLMKFVNGRWEIDWEDLEKRASDPGTKVSIFCNPQNPVGRTWSRDEVTRYAQICLKHNVLMLSDEIHCDFVGHGVKYTPFSTLDDKKLVDNSITFKAASKSFSLAGLKCAWYFATDPEVFKQVQFWNRSEVSTLGIASSQAAYAGGEDWLNQCVDYIDGNQKFANDYIKAKLPLLKVGNKPEGTYLAWVDVSGLAEKIGAQKLADAENKKPQPINFLTGKPGQVLPDDMVGHWLAKNAYVQLNPGYSYGTGGINHMRMNIATSRKTLTAALDSMANAMKGLA